MTTLTHSHPATTQAAQSERGLLAYLLLPRPGDTSKWLIIPAGFALGVLAAGSVGRASLDEAILVWLVIEYLVYQARYQWNDIRGFAADQHHPDRQSRGRLPGPSWCGRRNIALSAMVAFARLGLAGVLILLLPARLTSVAYLAAMAVLVVAAGYEALRSLVAVSARGDRARPAARTRLPVLLLWLVSGLGYLVRGLTGLALAIDLDWQLALVGGLALWAGGVGFVTARWAVESLAFGRLAGGRVSWSATPRQAREHQLALARWLPEPEQPPAGGLPRWRPLRHGSRLTAPWNLALLATLPTAAAAGVRLGGTDSPAALATAVGIGLLTAGGLVLRPRWSWAVAGLAILVIAESAVGVARDWVAVSPPLLAAAVYLCSMRQCLADIGQLCRPLRRREPR